MASSEYSTIAAMSWASLTGCARLVMSGTAAIHLQDLETGHPRAHPIPLRAVAENLRRRNPGLDRESYDESLEVVGAAHGPPGRGTVTGLANWWWSAAVGTAPTLGWGRGVWRTASLPGGLEQRWAPRSLWA